MVLITALIIWGVFYFRHHEGLVVIDAMDIAQEARHFALGKGLTTGFIKPLSILIQGGDADLPDFYNSPVYVILLSNLFKLFGFTDQAVIGGSFIWAFLTGVLLLIFARLFFNLTLSLLIFLLYAVNPGVIESAFSGLHLSFLSFLLVLFCLIYCLRNRSSLIWTGVLGFLAGILYLSEFDFLLLSLPIAVLVIMDSGEKKGRHALIFGLGFFLAASPWLIRNAIVVGNPFFSLRWFDFKAYTTAFPANKIVRDFDPLLLSTPLPLIIFLRKFFVFMRLMYRYWLALSHSFLIPFFFASVLLRLGDKRGERVKKLVLLLFFSELLLIAAGNGDLSRILIFLPLICLLGMMAVRSFLQKITFRSKTTFRVVIGIFFLINIYPGVSVLFFGLPGQRYISPVFSRAEAESIKKGESLEQIRGLIKSDEVVVSDIPWAVAWYANRNAIWLPWKVEQMKTLKRRFKNVRFLYLTPVLFKYPDIENMAAWQSIYRSGMVPEWLQVDRGLLMPGEELIMGDIIFERLDLE